MERQSVHEQINVYERCYFRYTKMGFAGNTEPQYIIPSSIAIKENAKVGDQASRRIGKGVEDLDFYIGDEALEATNYAVKVSHQMSKLQCVCCQIFIM